MKRTGILLLAMLAVLQCPASGQGVFDSVFGPGGLGITGGGQTQPQFDNPRYYGGNVDPSQQYMQQQPEGYPQQGGQGYPQQGYAQGYPQQGYGYAPGYDAGPQQGLYSDWQTQPYGSPGQQPMQYGPPPEAQMAPQAPPQASQRPRVAAPPQVRQQSQPTVGAQQQGAARSPQSRTSVRPGQYPGDPQQTGRFGDDLPAGAVRITTTTPEGTSVQFYPPSGTSEYNQQGVQPQSRQARPRAASSRAPKQSQVAPSPEQSASASSSSIAMPKPVPMPRGEDPRAGWGPAVNRGPAETTAR